MAPPSTSAAGNGTSQAPMTTARSRPQARRKANPTADDAAYHGVLPSGAGSKRAATDKAEGEPRVKRKRVEASGSMGTLGISTTGRKGADKGQEAERKSLVDFTKLPLDAIYRYLVEYDIVPELDPLPTTAYDPPSPSSLLKPRGQRSSTASPGPQLPPTPANRPRRELSASTGRRRSSRLLDDDRRPGMTPVLADVGEVHKTLAQIAERHFKEQQVKEMDVMGSFIWAAKAKARMRG